MSGKRLFVAALIAVPLLLVVACGGDSESVTATMTPSGLAAPTATRASEGASPTATTRAATATPRPATATAAVTNTPAPTATEPPPTETPVPPTTTPEPPTPVPPTATQPPPPPPPTATTAPVVAGPQSLYVTAQALKFSPTTLYASSGATVTITMNNQDNFVPHNVSVTGLGTSATCSGPCTASVTFTAPGPGSYGFICTVHPYMTGTLVVQ